MQKNINTFNKIKSIIFTEKCNERIYIFPKSVISITFGYYYNQPLPSLQNTNIKKTHFGSYYNLPLLNLQNTKLKSITFGYHFNQQLPSLQNTNLKSITY